MGFLQSTYVSFSLVIVADRIGNGVHYDKTTWNFFTTDYKVRVGCNYHDPVATLLDIPSSEKDPRNKFPRERVELRDLSHNNACAYITDPASGDPGNLHCGLFTPIPCKWDPEYTAMISSHCESFTRQATIVCEWGGSFTIGTLAS
jgi:hypothetical protein